MKYEFDYSYTNERIRFFLVNDKDGPIYTDEYIDFSKWGTQKLKYVDKIIDEKLNKLVDMCKLIVPNLKIDSYDRINTKLSAVQIITEKVNEKLKQLENTISKLNVNIKDWYIENYPSDELGETLSPFTTFLDLNNLLNSGNGRNVYELLGGDSDTVIRERCFEKLAKLLNCDYNHIYKQWIKKEEKEEEIEK